MSLNSLLKSILLAACVALPTHAEICIKPHKGYHYLTCSDYQFSVNDTVYTIPKGFDTDLASIPRIAWSIMSPAKSELITAAIIHDWFYRMSCDFNRIEADMIFYSVLLENHVPAWQASIMYYAVRLFGSSYYNEDYCE